jgi:hypothetical protein
MNRDLVALFLAVDVACRVEGKLQRHTRPGR